MNMKCSNIWRAFRGDTDGNCGMEYLHHSTKPLHVSIVVIKHANAFEYKELIKTLNPGIFGVNVMPQASMPIGPMAAICETPRSKLLHFPDGLEVTNCYRYGNGCFGRIRKFVIQIFWTIDGRAVDGLRP